MIAWMAVAAWIQVPELAGRGPAPEIGETQGNGLGLTVAGNNGRLRLPDREMTPKGC